MAASEVPGVWSVRRGGVSRGARSALRLLNRYSFGFALLLSVVLFVVTSLRSGNLNWGTQLGDFAPMALAAIASTPAIISGGGGIDVSISPLMVTTGAAYILWLVPHGMGGAVAIPILLAMGLAVGVINGLLIIVLRIPAVVVTLSIYFILLGVNLLIVPSTATIEHTWLTHLANDVGPIPGGLFVIGFPLVIWIGLGRIPYRRLLYAVGSNDATAFSSGVNVPAIRVAAYALGGLFAAVGGIAVVAVSLTASANLSATYTLSSIAAVALGGTSLSGGRGGLVGSLAGAASIYLLGLLLVTFQISPSWLQVTYGVMLLVAVVLVSAAAESNES